MSEERNNSTENDEQAADETCRVELHKMAEHAADPVLTDMFEIVAERERRNRATRSPDNVLMFPYLRTRQPGEAAAFDPGRAAAEGRNIVMFRWKRR
ncbi:hypothetical protein [Agrobacterium tumefaciens]|uniref:hypothetical protein n=1 Tax=Agrobacterium tumefaciens TaxID=358 RepID=UPI00287E5709|nr:hypothetical protein [Agrobacterium tumefaciens]MDS7597798.1 hypothetical protein [Agrobacterium tumefaciens]